MELVLLNIIVFCFIILDVKARIMVDLTHQYNDNKTAWYPGDRDMTFTVNFRGWYDLPGGNGKAWAEINEFSMVEHFGTHMDAPSHMARGPGQWRLHQIPIERFVGNAVVIDISHKAVLIDNPDAIVEVSDLQMYEEKYGKIQDGSIILVYTGWEKYWGNEVKYLGNDKHDISNLRFPGMGKEAAQWLVDNRRISGLGIDTMSLDAGYNLNYPVHVILLSDNIYGLENVKNIGKLPPAGARVSVFPLKLYDGSGAPTRIIAEYGDDDVMHPRPPNSAISLCFDVGIIIGVMLYIMCFK